LLLEVVTDTFAMMSETPAERVQRLQYSLVSLQDKHARVLKNVYDEIQTMQKQYARLTNQVAESHARDNTTTEKRNDDTTRNEKLETEIAENEDAIREVKKSLEVCEERLQAINNKTKVTDEENKNNVHKYIAQVEDLERKVKSKSEHIAYLTTQLRKQRSSKHVINNNENTIVKKSSNGSFFPTPPQTPNSHRRFGGNTCGRSAANSTCSISSSPVPSTDNVPRCEDDMVAIRSSTRFHTTNKNNERKYSLSRGDEKHETRESHTDVHSHELSALRPLPPITPSPHCLKYTRKKKYITEVNKRD